MSKILPNQVYAGLFEILKNKNLYYHSTVSPDYCHLTDAGKEAVIEWINMMAPQMHKLEQAEIDARAKKMIWDELKK